MTLICGHQTNALRCVPGSEFTLDQCRHCWMYAEKNSTSNIKQATDFVQVQIPGFVQKMINATGAVVQHISGGMRHTSEEQRQARLLVCHDCPMFSSKTCALCGCKLWIKAGWADQHCPHPDNDKWVEIDKKFNEGK